MVKACLAPCRSAGRQVDVPLVQGGRHLIQADLAAGQGLGVELHPHGILLGTVDQHLGHAVDHGDARGDDRIGKFVDLRQRQGRRTEGQIEHRLVGRVDLLVGGGCRHVLGQLAGRLGDGRLHILGGRIDALLQGELEGDDRDPLTVGGGHGVQAGDGRELRSSGVATARGHGLRAGAGQVGPHLDGGIVDVRQVVDRQQPVGKQTEDHHRQHDQAGHDRTFYEEFGDIHRFGATLLHRH